MANNINLKITNYGLQKVMQRGAEKSFKYFSLSDMNEIYHVTTDPNLSDIMNMTGSKTLFTVRKSCNDAVPTVAQVTEPTDTMLNETSQRWLVNFYKKDCGSNDFDKSNLTATINLHEYFNWLSGLTYSAYSETTNTSLDIFEGVSLIKQEQDFVTNVWSNIDTTNDFALAYEFMSDQDKNNYLSFNSKNINYRGVQRYQVDKSFDRFYTSLLFGFGNNISGSKYLQGHNSYLTFNAPQFGFVVNGTTNFINLKQLEDTTKYKEIRPAVMLGPNTTDIYYLTESNSFRTTDRNGFMGPAIWGYKNNDGQALIIGMIEKAKNHIEFFFKETSFDKWELPINMRVRIQSKLKIVGGNIKYNFVYEPGATMLGYNNIIILE